MVSKASRLLAGAIVLAGCAFGPQALAQSRSNPFVPASQAQRADIERIVDARIKEAEARVLAAVKAQAGKGATSAIPGAAGVPGAPVSPGAPGAPVSGTGPLTPGAAGPSYPPVGGAVGGVGVVQAPQQSEIQTQRQAGTRFLGCINGTHKFMKTTGERVTFSPAQINRAVKDGELPACR